MKTKLFILLLAIVASIVTCQAAIINGTCGKWISGDNYTLTWTFNTKTGVLTIEGKGDMSYYYSHSNQDCPWWEFRKEITSVILPDGLTSIEHDAFMCCENLTSVTIPNSVKTIGPQAFYRCSSLTSIVIPNSVTSIGHGIFERCTGLTSVTLPNGIDYIPRSAFTDCVRLRAITIPNTVTEIGDAAFAGCRSLTSIVIPKNVTVMGMSSFNGCNIVSFTIYAPTPPSRKDHVWYGDPFKNEKCTLYVPASAIETYSNSFWWEDFKEIKAIK